MGLLDEVLVRNPPFALYRLRESLGCTRLLSAGSACGRATHLALVYEKDDDFVVFPVCEMHLPSWCKDVRADEVVGERAATVRQEKHREQTRNARAKTKSTRNLRGE